MQPNYLVDERDQSATVLSLKLARRLLQTAAMRPFLNQETLPGQAVTTDDEWLDYARQRLGTAYHLGGSCQMGPSAAEGPWSDRGESGRPDPRRGLKLKTRQARRGG